MDGIALWFFLDTKLYKPTTSRMGRPVHLVAFGHVFEDGGVGLRNDRAEKGTSIVDGDVTEMFLCTKMNEWQEMSGIE